MGHPDAGVAGRGHEIVGDALARFQRAYGQRHLRSSAEQCAGSLDANPGRRSGNDSLAVRQVDAGHDVGSGGLAVKRRGDQQHGRSFARVSETEPPPISDIG